MNRNTLAFNMIPKPKTQDQILSDYILSFTPQAIQQKQPLKGADPKLLINNEASVPRQGEQVSEIVEETQAVAPVTPSVAPAAPAAPVIDENTVDFSSMQEMPMPQPVQQESQLRRLLTDPKTYETIANLGAAYSAYKGNVPLAETLSGIAGNIQTERVGREEAQRKALDPTQNILNMQRMAQIDKAKAETELAKQQAGQITTQVFGVKFESIDRENENFKNLLDDPEAIRRGIVSSKKIEGMPNLAGITTDLNQRKEYLGKKVSDIKDYKDSIAETKNIIDRTDKILESDLSKTLGVTSVLGVFNIPRIKLGQVLGLNQKQIDNIANIDQLDADKFGALFKSLRSPKTGATGFGSLSEKEFLTVGKMIANLDKAQSEELFRSQLIEIRDFMENKTLEKQDNIIRDYGNENIERYIPVAEQRARQQAQQQVQQQVTDYSILSDIDLKRRLQNGN